MNRFVIAITLSGAILSANAQLSPIQLEVKAGTKKKQATTGPGNDGNFLQSRSLTITVRNAASQPTGEITVRWGIVRTDSGGPGGRDEIRATRAPHTTAYGAEETIELKPMETKIIETASVQAEIIRRNFLTADSGEKIIGHGVQILIGGKVVREDFQPPTVKPYFEKLQPIEDADKEKNQDRPPPRDGRGPRPPR